ncbi:hypothetical protein [Actinoplanes sp. NPDC026670]|uniref:hypothetical protein n=1 Tax=Actinoplanes sp. NPDC026670 TaxID=3154700 RepID=UPI0033DD5CD4
MTVPTLIRVDSIYREIPLSRGHVAIVDAADYDMLVAAGSWSLVVDGWNTYAKSKAGLMHRLILPGFACVDHRNGVGLDNRKANLRGATTSQNGGNARLSRRNASGFKGVSLDRTRATLPWQVRIGVAGKLRKVGRYATPVEAALAYDKAARDAFGEFAAVNFPEPGERSALVPSL